MTHKTFTIDFALLTRKFYCHKCGMQLIKFPRNRLIKRKDPEHKEYSRIGHKFILNDIQHIDYDLKCTECDRIIVADEQYVIEKIQKTLKKTILSDSEVSLFTTAAHSKIERKKKLINIISKISIIAILVVYLYFIIKTGDFALRLKFGF